MLFCVPCDLLSLNYKLEKADFLPKQKQNRFRNCCKSLSLIESPSKQYLLLMEKVRVVVVVFTFKTK